MPRLNLLRPHRRSQVSTTPATTTTVAAVPLALPSPPPQTGAPPAPPASSALPPIDIDSPGLGSPGQWLEANFSGDTTASARSPPPPLSSPPPPPPPPPSTATATPAPSSQISRTSTPYTAPNSELSLKTAPAPQVLRPPSRPKSKTPATHVPAAHSLSAAALGTAYTTDKLERVKESRKDKLGRLNPMSLLRRRASQKELALDKERLRVKSTRELPDDFDPGIIYGTRHPDWSHPKRGLQDQRRGLSPVPVGPGSPGLPVKGDTKNQLKLDIGDEGIDARIGLSTSPEVRYPPEAEKPLSPTRSPSPPLECPPPPPVAQVETLNREAMSSATPITPGTIIPSRSPSVHSFGDPDSPSEDRPRGVTLVDHPLALPHHQIVNSSRFSFEGSSKAPSTASSIKQYDDDDDNESYADGSFQFDLDDGGFEDDGFERANEGLFEHQDGDQYTALQAAVEAMDMNTALGQHEIGMALSDNVEIRSETGTNPKLLPPEDDLPSMSPQAGKQPKEIALNLRNRIANPRGLDLSDDSDLDFIDDEHGLAGYEDDDDDLYYDDGIITEVFPDQPPEAPVKQMSLPPPLTIPTAPPSPPPPPPPPAEAIGKDQHFLGDPVAAHRISMVSSGLVPEDGSINTQSESPTAAFPPFLNPVGGGLGFTPSQYQFYNPSAGGANGSSHLNTLTLSTLTHTLQQYQQHQQSLAGTPSEPGYDSDINERPNFDYDYDYDYEEDEAMVAAANADALESDHDGFYGSEFGFYSTTADGGSTSHQPLRPPARHPSLTPISERSESSYRNSLVLPRTASWVQDDPAASTELSLGQLLQMWGDGGGGESPGLYDAPPMYSSKPPPPPQQQQQQGTSPIFITTPPGLGPPPGLGTPSGLLPPGFGATPPPPGLLHPGANAMLPTKGSFEDSLRG